MSAQATQHVLTLPVTGRDHVQGPATAPVTLVEYGDYQCPDCGRAHPIVKQIQQRLGRQLRFVFRNFPLTHSHEHALQAAEAAEAAGAQGRFWAMHDLIYEHQRALETQHLLSYAERLGLDVGRFEQDLVGHVHLARVKADFEGGDRSGVNGTPTFFINGLRHDDSYDEETLLAALEAAAPAKPSKGRKKAK